MPALWPRFDDELAYGLDYQRAYQEHEAAKLAAGADPFNLYLHDDFARGPIATTPGPEEWYVFRHSDDRLLFHTAAGGGALAAGVVGFLTAVWLTRRAARVIAPPRSG